MNENRQMFKGDWACSECNKAITELPFEPRETGNLMCFDCHKAKRPQKRSSERRMFSGNWNCNSCKGDINELPFEPRDTSNLMCRDCFRKSKS